MQPPSDFVRQLRATMLEKGWKQKHLAAHLRVNQGTVSTWLRGGVCKDEAEDHVEIQYVDDMLAEAEAQGLHSPITIAAHCSILNSFQPHAFTFSTWGYGYPGMGVPGQGFMM